MGLVTINFGLIDKIAGEGIKMKLASEVAVWPLALTVIGPVLAPAGTVVTRLEAVAERTVAAVPLKKTVFSAAVGLNPWPWIVTVAPTPPRDGVKFRIASVA